MPDSLTRNRRAWIAIIEIAPHARTKIRHSLLGHLRADFNERPDTFVTPIRNFCAFASIGETAMRNNPRIMVFAILYGLLLAMTFASLGYGSGGGNSCSTKGCFQCAGLTGQAALVCRMSIPRGCPNFRPLDRRRFRDDMATLLVGDSLLFRVLRVLMDTVVDDGWKQI